MQLFVPNLQSCLGPNFLHKLPGEFAMSTICHELQRFNKKSRIGNWQHCCSHGKDFSSFKAKFIICEHSLPACCKDVSFVMVALAFWNYWFLSNPPSYCPNHCKDVNCSNEIFSALLFIVIRYIQCMLYTHRTKYTYISG